MRYSLVILAALVSAAPLAAQEASDSKTIVVTARSLKDTADALAACLARNCPPDEDVKATLAHAENQFVAGDYKDARGTLLKSVGRNRREAKAYPVPLGDLHRANARIAAHLGERESYQAATIDSREALKAGLPADDFRILVSTIEVADMRARLGYAREAERMYRDVTEKADAKGWKAISFSAQLRTALLLMRSDNSDEKRAGRRQLEAIASLQGEDSASLRLAARILIARVDRQGGKAGGDAAAAALVAEYAKLGGATRPTLLYSDPIKQPDDPRAGGDTGGTQNALSQIATQNFEDRWVDIGFWVNPDGKTDEIEILRQSGTDVFWTKPVVTSIKSRIYAPLKVEPGDPGFYQVERYTLTSFWEERLGTRIRQRSGAQRIERMDLSADVPEEKVKG